MTKKIFTAVSIAFIALFICCTGAEDAKESKISDKKGNKGKTQDVKKAETSADSAYLFGIPCNGMIIEKDTFKKNETLAEVLYGLGFNSQQIYNLTQCSDSVFDDRKIRPGETCTLFSSKDSIARYLVREEKELMSLLTLQTT